MSEIIKSSSIFSQLVIGVAVTVIGAFIVDKVSTNNGADSPQDNTTGRTIIQDVNSPPSKSGNNQSGTSAPGNSTRTDPQNHSEANTYDRKVEDFSSYINPTQRANVSIIIVDASGNLSNTAASAVAGVYQKSGKSTSVGLIRGAFVRKHEFLELCEGNSEIIQKLNLADYADYLAIGRINYTKRPGSLVDGTVVSTASISMSIISTNSKSLINSFAISNATGNGATESQAKEDALQKLLDKYYNYHSTL